MPIRPLPSLSVGLLSLLLVGTAACGDRGGSSVADAPGGVAEAEPGGTAVLAEVSDIERPNPLFWQRDIDSDLADVMYMSLLRSVWRENGMHFATAEESPMAIARRYTYVGPDSSAIRMHLRSDLQWSDGTPMTAHDAVWTYRMLKSPEVASPRMSETEQMDSVIAQNDSTITFHFARRHPEMLFNLGVQVMPRHVFEGTGAGELGTHPVMTDPRRSVVSGPFMIGEWRPGQETTLVPNPRGPVQPHLERIVIRVVPDPTTRLTELQTQRVDWARPISFEQVPQLRERAPFVRFESVPKRFYEYIAYNPEAHPAFADREVRRALGLGVDVQGLIRALQMSQFTEPASGPFPPILSDLHDPRHQPQGFEPAEARQILEARGWRDADGDGIREKDGRPLRFTLLTNTGNQRRADVMQMIQQQWRQIGVDARLQQVEFATFMGRQVEQDYEAALGGWGVALNGDLTSIWGEDADFNIVSFSDPEAQRLMRRAREARSREEAIPYWRAAADRIVQTHPYTWLYYYDVVTGVNQRLRDVEMNPLGSFQNSWEWWIPRDQQTRGGAARDTTRQQ